MSEDQKKPKFRHWVEAWSSNVIPPKATDTGLTFHVEALGRSGPFYERAAAEKFAAGLAATGRATRAVILTEKSETGAVWSPVVES